MNEPPKPDGNELARHILYNFAALTAEVRELKFLLADALAHIKHLPAEQVRLHYSPMVREETDRLYAEYLDAVKLPPPPDPPPEFPPFPGRGSNPRV